jgi:hypothetical protein
MTYLKEKVRFNKSEELVDLLSRRIQNDDKQFYRLLVAYFFGKVASNMRANIHSKAIGKLPINLYVINLANSGAGKSYSNSILEHSIFHLFRQIFVTQTMPAMVDKAVVRMGMEQSLKTGNPEEEEQEVARKEIQSLGSMLFSFDSGTSPAFKQLRQLLLNTGIGALSLEMDEIARNISSNSELFTALLETYDSGYIKTKLIKHTKDQPRSTEIIGQTPSNMLLYGTPSVLLNGGAIEEEFKGMLETGYSRRSLFGYNPSGKKPSNKTAKEIYKALTSDKNQALTTQMANDLALLADISNLGRTIEVTEDITILLIEYRLYCERKAAELSEYDKVEKAEIMHRYMKVYKLMGAYAFIDNKPEVSKHHLNAAITLVEESGEAFKEIIKRDPPYIRLAKYLAEVKKDCTQADLVSVLPYYKGTESAKQTMLKLATAWGYRNNITIYRKEQDGIEFIKGETLRKTNLNKIVISYSTKVAEDYLGQFVPFNELHKLMQSPTHHWVNHHLQGNYRNEDNCLKGVGFNCVVLDVEKSVDIPTARLLMKDFTYLLYTTKRHTEQEHRYRIVLPISHHLHLEADIYKQFMNNIYSWLPFDVDKQTNQRARKWLTHKGMYQYNEATMLDALLFLPKTDKAESLKRKITETSDLTNLERWFVSNVDEGRNNQLIKYGLMLVDAKFPLDVIQTKILNLNAKFSKSLSETEVLSTVMITVAKAMVK